MLDELKLEGIWIDSMLLFILNEEQCEQGGPDIGF